MKKDFLNLKRSRWLLLSLFALFVGVSPAGAETLTANFDSGLPAGWSLVGSVTNDNTRARSGNGLWTYSSSDNANYVITEEVEGSITFYARAYGKNTNAYVFIYAYDGSALGEQLYVTANMKTSSSTISFSSYTANLGDYKGQVAIALNYAAIDDVTYTQMEVADGPALVVKDGSKVTSPYAYDFGLTTAGTTHVFTLTNPGTAAVEGLSVSETGSFGATLSATTIAAKGEATLTITMPAATGSSEITISSSTEGIADFVINASGTVKDPNKFFIDFSEAPLPVTWTMDTGWSITSGYAHAGWSASSIRSGQIIAEDGEQIMFKHKGSSSYSAGVLKVYWATTGNGDEADWDAGTSIATTYNVWNTAYVTIPKEAKYIRIYGQYVDIDDFYGLSAPSGAMFAIDTDGTAQDYGMVMKDASATKTFTVTNTGNAALDVTFAPSAGFSTVPASLNVAGGASETFDVVMNTATAGAKSGNVVLSFDALNATEFTIPVTGYVADPDKIYADFNDNQLPTGWSDNTGWTFSDGKAVAGYDTQMTLPALTVAEGEKLAISVMGTGSYKELYYYTSTDGGTSWSAKSTNLASSISTSAYSVVYIEGLAAGNYKLKLQGYQVKIDAINGFTLNAAAPALTVTLGGAPISTGYADNFGGKVKAQPAAHTYTITNSGTGTLEGTITSSVPGHFTVSQSAFSLTEGQSLDFDLNLVFNETYEDKASTITIHPTSGGLADVVINATATTADPNIWDEDFEGGSVPEGWIANDWTVTNSNYNNNGTYMFAAGSSNTKTAYSPRLYAEKDQVLSFYVGGADATDFQTVKWSHDRNAAAGDWTLIGEFTSAGTQEFTAPETGYYYLSFQGRYTSVDNFYGFKEAPLAHDAYITAQNIPATGTQYVEYTATVTVKEMAGKSEDLTAKFFIGGVQYGADVVETVEANGTKTFTVTFTPDAAVSGDAHFTVTNGDINLTSDNVAVAINAAFVLDETIDNTINLTVEETKPAVVVNYSKAAGKWGTIALPFQTTTEELSSLYGTTVKAFTFAANDGGNLTFETATTLYAGYPYVIYSDGAMSGEVKFFNKAVTTTANSDVRGDVTFQTNYAPKTYTGGDSWYGITPAGEIRPAGAGASVKALRGYLQATAGARLSIFIEDLATGITTVLSPKEFEAEGAYNLQGQKVQQTKKGLYIVNGRKVVVK